MKTYKSKIGLELIIPLVILFSLPIYNFIISKNWENINVLVLPIIIVFLVFFNTKYSIENKNLNVKCSFLVDIIIDIKSIQKISETYNLISSPATSIDRLEIRYNKNDKVLISPKDKKGFIDSLTAINPNIEVVYRKNN